MSKARTWQFLALAVFLSLNAPLAAQIIVEDAGSLAGAPGNPAKAFADVPTSHEKTADIPVKSSDGKYRLQTVSIDRAGRILALAAPPKSFGPPMAGATAELQIYTPEGKLSSIIKLAFHANSIAGGPDGNLYVAGEGKVVKFSAEGKPLAEIELPFIKEMLADKEGPRKAAEEMVKLQRASMEKIVVQYKDRLKVLEEKKEEDRTALEKRQIEQFKLVLKSYEPRLGKDDALLDQMVAQITSRLKTINAIAFSEKDVFVACGSTKGFGYAVWRMDHEFKNPKQVRSDVRGCCGQMDINCCNDDLLIAENTNHRFARYDREGTPMGAWGKRGTRVGELETFGGCCNPMNIKATTGGDIFTAESEGVIKRFSPKGEFLGLVATVPLTGAGCKNVAFAVSPDENRIYFLDLNGSRILVLSKKASK